MTGDIEIAEMPAEYRKCPCDHCGNHIEFPADGLGLTISCPHCGHDTLLYDEAQNNQTIAASSATTDNEFANVVMATEPSVVHDNSSCLNVGDEFDEPASSTAPNEVSFISALTFFERKHRELCWVHSNEPVEVGGFRISAGMFYMANGNTAQAEASAINIRQPIGNPAAGEAVPLGYYSQYQWISPDQRAAYLKWLAFGRRDAVPEARDLGYLFLYFYGLERRLLVEKAPDQEAVAEVVRLLYEYGAHARSRSLSNYFCQLIHFWGWSQGEDYYPQLLDWMRTLPVSLLGADELAIVLAGHYKAQKRLAPDLAYTLTSRHEDARRSVIISRVNQEFRDLFAKRYLEQFPEGMLLERAKRASRLEYRPASPTLLQYRYGNNSGLSIAVPDVLGLSSQFRLLPKLWNSCIEDLSNYSRAKSKTEAAKPGLKAYLALPDELRAGSLHPLAEQWKGILSQARAGGGGHIIDVGEAASLIDLPQRSKLTISQSRQVAEVIESLGYGVEPDSHSDGSYAWDQLIGVFSPADGILVQPSPIFSGTAALLKLCIFISEAGGQVATEGLNVARRFIGKNLILSAADSQRLDVLEQVLIADPSTVKNSLSRLTKNVPKEQREKICELLVYVAAHDSVVTKDEMRALGKVFKGFGLPEEKLNQYLTSIRPEFREVTIQSPGGSVPGETIPAPGKAFSIDMSRVDRISQETAEVIGILSKVMVDDDDPENLGESKSAENNKNIIVEKPDAATPNPSKTSVPVPSWLHSLDAKYQEILLQMLQQSSWSRNDFNHLAGNFRLMPLDAHDAINEWADEHLGDFLLEGDDPILVRKELIK